MALLSLQLLFKVAITFLHKDVKLFLVLKGTMHLKNILSFDFLGDENFILDGLFLVDVH